MSFSEDVHQEAKFSLEREILIEDLNREPIQYNGNQTPTFRPSPDDTTLVETTMSTADGKRKRVGFTQDTGPLSRETLQPSSCIDERRDVAIIPGPSIVSLSDNSLPSREFQRSNATDLQQFALRRIDISDLELSMGVHAAFGQPFVPKPRPAIRRPISTPDVELAAVLDVDLNGTEPKVRSGLEAHDRAQKLAARVGSFNVSGSASRRNSEDLSGLNLPESILSPIRRAHILYSDGSEDLSDDDVLYQKPHGRLSAKDSGADAQRLVKSYTHLDATHYDMETPPLRSGLITPKEEQDYAEDYVPKPQSYRGGVLAALLKLRSHHDEEDGQSYHIGSRFSRPLSFGGLTPSHTPSHTPPISPQLSGTTSPTSRHSLLHWPRRHGGESPYGLSHLIGSSSTLALPQKDFGEHIMEKGKLRNSHRAGMGKRTKSSEALAYALKRMRPRLDEQIKITVHIAETLARQKYLVKLCRALMEYGAPTHRLEEYMRSSSRVLEIESQFLYIPGCMFISFDDPTTHTTEVKLVRTSQGVDLGKLRDTHRIYKEVVHDRIGVEEATRDLDEVIAKKKKFNRWFLVFVYGLASASVGPFAFQARLIDLPIAFFLGCLLGFLQLVVSPRSDLYANIFEITAAIFTSFLARGFGSIQGPSGNPLFCFSALAQSSIALILPGYTVLCASLELQSRSIVAGSVRMVYAIIYSLFLGYGITIGTTVYGFMDHKATSATQCTDLMPQYWAFFFVPVFTMCLIIINQSKWKQAPMMVIIAFAGYVVNFFSSRRLVGNTQVSQTLGALTIGIMANLYARLGSSVENTSMKIWDTKIRPLLWRARSKLYDVEKTNASGKHPKSRKREIGYGMGAAAMLPAIFVQVPSGLSVSGSLVSGITSANQILGNMTGTTTVSSGSDVTHLNDAAFNVGYSVIQVAIGITVGLFLSALVVYPFGKKRSGLFSF